MEIEYNTRQWQHVSLGYEFGKNFNSDFTHLSGRLQQNITKDLSIQYSLTRLTQSPDPENKSTWIHVIRATQFFTKDLYPKLFYQINSVIDKKETYRSFLFTAFSLPLARFNWPIKKERLNLKKQALKITLSS